MKYNFHVLFLVLFLSCEEVQVEELLNDVSTDNTPITTIITVDTLFESSSVSLNWTGNDYAISFSYRLEPKSYTDTVQTYTNWSNWDTLNTVTFTNLDDGSYNFYIKSRYTVENEEAVQSIQFIIDAIAGPAIRMYPLYQRVASGENFSMYVYIEDVVDLRGLELHLSYPSSIITANSMTLGDILSNSTIVFDTINPTEGTIELITTYEDVVGYTGTGTLAKINLTAGEVVSLDTLHIKDTSILRTSLNVPIDILDRVYGLIEVIE
jgi:hypothetical protein